MDVFVYSKRQDDLVGRDGLEAFSGVFGDQSRVVVILQREGWGQTPWTRVEETAIKNRGLEQGCDFVLLVKLDPTAAIPKWLPKTRIWLGFDKYGIDGTASAIEALVQQTGGIGRAESAVDYAARVARNINFEQERRGRYSSRKGVEEAQRRARLPLENFLDLLMKYSRNTRNYAGCCLSRQSKPPLATGGQKKSYHLNDSGLRVPTWNRYWSTLAASRWLKRSL